MPSTTESLASIHWSRMNSDRTARFKRPALPPRSPAELEAAQRILDNAKRGDRLTILTPHGSRIRGRVVMHGPAGVVLNAGGAHGTPAIATARNLVIS